MSNAYLLSIGVILPLAFMYFIMFGGIKIRDRKLERIKEQNRHHARLEALDQSHRERMKIIETMKKRELDEALEQIDGQIEDLQQKALGD